ncbi:MAG: alpha/beta hydrolase [Candidatus Binataceae bacterium]
MATAPDYQARYPIDFAEIDNTVRQTVVQLYAVDGGKSRGILYMPPQGRPRTVVIMAHPRADFGQHYSIPHWLRAGIAAFAQNTRYLNNDAMMLHENLLLDLAASIGFLREERNFEHIIMLGNSGGGSLFAYYDTQARTPVGQRDSSPPGGGPPDLNRFNLPTADGLILLAAHPGQGKVLMGAMDASVVDEHDPYATDTALDMYDERNGYRPPSAESRYERDWLTRYRNAQAARVARIDAIARAHLEESQNARGLSKAPDFTTRSAAYRNSMQRRAMAPHIMVVYRTLANPNYLDLTLEPSERSLGSIFAPRPDLFNYHAFGLGHVVTPDAWLSTWSGLSSNAYLARNLPHVTVPTLVVGARADQDIFESDVRAQFEQSSATDKRIEMITGADHFMRVGGTKPASDDPRPRVVELLSGWVRERFA